MSCSPSRVRSMTIRSGRQRQPGLGDNAACIEQEADTTPAKSTSTPAGAGGPFVHSCYCGKWGFFGYDVALLKGLGTWFCAEASPDDEAGLEFAGALA